MPSAVAPGGGLPTALYVGVTRGGRERQCDDRPWAGAGRGAKIWSSLKRSPGTQRKQLLRPHAAHQQQRRRRQAHRSGSTVAVNARAAMTAWCAASAPTGTEMRTRMPLWPIKWVRSRDHAHHPIRSDQRRLCGRYGKRVLSENLIDHRKSAVFMADMAVYRPGEAVRGHGLLAGQRAALTNTISTGGRFPEVLSAVQLPLGQQPQVRQQPVPQHVEGGLGADPAQLSGPSASAAAPGLRGRECRTALTAWAIAGRRGGGCRESDAVDAEDARVLVADGIAGAGADGAGAAAAVGDAASDAVDAAEDAGGCRYGGRTAQC